MRLVLSDISGRDIFRVYGWHREIERCTASSSEDVDYIVPTGRFSQFQSCLIIGILWSTRFGTHAYLSLQISASIHQILH